MQSKVLLLLLLALILEVSVTTIPLVLIVLLCLTVIYRQEYVFFLAFIFGIFLDLFLVKTIGLTSGYFVFILFLILIYQRKFEIATNYFVFIAASLGSLGFLFFFSSKELIILQAFVSGLVGITIFQALKKLEKNKTSPDDSFHSENRTN